MLRHVEGWNMCIELMYNRHNGKIIVMRRYERGSGSCLGSVVAKYLSINYNYFLTEIYINV